MKEVSAVILPKSLQAGNADTCQFILDPSDPDRALQFRCNLERPLNFSPEKGQSGFDPLAVFTILTVAGLLLVFGSPELVVINLSNSNQG